ncbi:MAG: polysaccharide pyruvyl transferase family protein [Candidatus Accumulibacter sp.]|nr:polysaccharide pyruvyl transferase family protein [Accumulibacter sp.]
MVMRVKLLTYHFSDNYGALFQAYALRQWFRRQGVEAEFINYHPRYVEEGGSFDQLLNPRQWRKNMTIGYLKATHLYWSVFGNGRQRLAFDDFRRQYLGVGGVRLMESSQAAGAAEADLLVCGSDQIWNPSVQKGLDPVYFLDFGVHSRVRRISYAPSFGRSELAPSFHAEAGRLIGRLDAISVREQSGVDIVRTVTGREAQCVPDPTILLGDFSELLAARREESERHVFCYALRTAEVIRDVAEHVAKAYGARLISPCSARQRWRAIGTGVEPGPLEWLRLLDSASTVVTNSFHGVALSVIFNKPFVAVELPGKRGALNERVLNLLTHTGLLERVVNSADPKKLDSVMTRGIDWSGVNYQLAQMRAVGVRFLMDQMVMCGGQSEAARL